MKRKISNITAAIGAVMLAGAMTGCVDDLFDAPRTEADSQLTIKLAVPRSYTTRAVSATEGEEGKINDLRLIIFGYDGGTSLVNRTLQLPGDVKLSDNGTADYHIDGLQPGNYKVYVIANTGDELAGINGEDKLKEKLTDYSERMPQIGNLPMVYDSGSMISIESQESRGASVEAAMTIAAVKVRYNIIFDKANCGDTFGETGLKLTSMTATGVAKSAYLIENRDAKNIDTRSVTIPLTYYDTYAENQQNTTADNADVITVTGAGSDVPTDYTSTWVCQGTMYLPERYVAENGIPSQLKISGLVTDKNGNCGNVHCDYTIDMAQYDGNKENRDMPRGTYYEIIGKVAGLGSANLDTSIAVKDWMDQLINVDFTHTFLKVEKTELTVTSLDDATLGYDTDGSGLPVVECVTKLQSQDVVIASVSGPEKKITFSVNPAVSVSQLKNGEGKGTAECYVRAGNIRKRIMVNYDITPFFVLTPADTKIQWDATNNEMRTKSYTYRTNLGGIVLAAEGAKNTVYIDSKNTTAELTLGNSKIKFACAAPTQAMGSFTVTATGDPVTTTVHHLAAYPAGAYSESSYDSYKKAMTVTVMPSGADYRIYFRAINDWQIYNGGETNVSGEWLEGANSMGSKYPVEFTGTGLSNNNWIDYWYCAQSNGDSAWENGAGNKAPHIGSHRIYIWTQMGETSGNEDKPMIWRFTDDYIPSEQMIADATNAGWYYYNLPVNSKQKAQLNGATGDKNPEPGTTLMIFNNHTNAKNPGYSVHRATHHLDAGIPLFDYEDREGWVVYDPTSVPYYRIFDERPVIEDVQYIVYSDVKPSGWFNYYGVAQKETNQGTDVKQFEIYSKNVESCVQETINGKTYWKYTIRLKAPRGNYAKAIKINFDGFATGSSSSSNTTTTPQRVYYYCNNKGGIANPCIYIYNDSGGSYTTWEKSPAMIKDRDADGGTYYYYNVPSGYSNGRVIFKNADGSTQTPGQGQPGFQLEGKTKICYGDNNNDPWHDYSAGTTTTTTTTGKHTGYMLFGGRVFKDNTGYFNNTTKTWKAGKP